jgi:hypothetical protein
MTHKESDTASLDSSLLNADGPGAMEALNRAGNDAARLIEHWKSTANAAALVAVSDHASGNLRKLARRAISVLKSRGVALPEKARVSSLGKEPTDATVVEAYALPPDAAGGIVVVLAARTPTRRLRTAFVYLHDEFGIRRVESGEQSQSQLRDAMTRLVPGGAVKPVSVPAEWVRYRVAQARALHQTRGMPQPLGLTSAASLLEPVPADAPAHPLDREQLQPTETELASARAGSAALHRLPEFRAWLPSREAVDELLANVGQGITPGQDPTQDQLSQLIEAGIRSMTDRFFAPQTRERLVSTMKDSALSVLARDGRSAALQVVAAMQTISECGLITNPPHEVGFLRGFFDKAIAVLLAQGQGSLKIPVRQAGAPPVTDAEPGASAAPDPNVPATESSSAG